MIVVPSILPRSGEEARRALARLSRRTLLAELRTDALRLRDPSGILGGTRPPVILTCRRNDEGGLFTGTPHQETALLSAAVEAGAEFIDVEYSLGRAALDRLFASAGRRRVILSFHDPARTPRGLLRRFRAMAARRPAVVKVAVLARSFADTRAVLKVLEEAKRLRQPVVAIAMGEYGAYTRILQGALGGAFTYASYDAARPTAPGQISLDEMVRRYRADALGPRTRIFGLLGNPVSLSRGIEFHNAAFKRHGRDAVYVNFLADDPGDFLRTFGDRISGLSVTMPFKTGIAPYLDALDESARLTGSVNTVVRRSRTLAGSNTDFHAFLALMKRRFSPAGKNLVVLGTGGTAATVAAAAAVAGARVTVAGRNDSRARRLAERFGASWIPLSGVAHAGGGILVNATPVGMEAAPGRPRSVVPPGSLRGFDAVCDFANPPGGSTALIDDARSLGLALITGRELFELQARLQSRVFLGTA